MKKNNKPSRLIYIYEWVAFSWKIDIRNRKVFFFFFFFFVNVSFEVQNFEPLYFAIFFPKDLVNNKMQFLKIALGFNFTEMLLSTEDTTETQFLSSSILSLSLQQIGIVTDIIIVFKFGNIKAAICSNSPQKKKFVNIC